MNISSQLQVLSLSPTPPGGPSVTTPEEQRFIASIETPLRGLPKEIADLVVKYSSPCENALVSDLIDIDSNKLDRALKIKMYSSFRK